MLDDEILGPASQQIKLRIKQRAEKLKSDYHKKREELNRRGLLDSGMTVSMVAGLAKDYVIDQSQIAWSVLHRFVSTGKVAFYDGIAGDFKEIVLKYLSNRPEDIPEIKLTPIRLISKDERLMNVYKRAISEGHQQATDFVNSEIDLFVYTLKRESEGHEQASNAYAVTNIHGPVGAVQDGDQSTAHVNQTINTDANNAVAQALEFVEQLLAQSQRAEVSEEVEGETLELVAEGKKELSSPQPDRSKLKIILLGLKRTAQSLAALEGARQFISAALDYF